jgi:hypothetical protein
MFVNTDHQSQIDLRSHERINKNYLTTSKPTSINLQYNNNSANSDRKQKKKIDRDNKNIQNIPKLVQIQFAQFLNNLIEYSSELAYFAINAFQTSSLRRVQINTLVKLVE